MDDEIDLETMTGFNPITDRWGINMSILTHIVSDGLIPCAREGCEEISEYKVELSLYSTHPPANNCTGTHSTEETHWHTCSEHLSEMFFIAQTSFLMLAKGEYNDTPDP